MSPKDLTGKRSLRTGKRISKAYIDSLHERIASVQHRLSHHASSRLTSERREHSTSDDQNQGLPPGHAPLKSSGIHGGREPKAPLTNPLAFHITDWATGPMGKPLFMGTSSTWAFGRRVLGMTHMRLTGLPLTPDPDKLLFDRHVYDPGWDGNKANTPSNVFDVSNLPTADFARYLINSVKFHCGHLFYLFEEEPFMKQFAAFQQNPAEKSRSSPLWFCHYLLVLAFGKGFVVQSVRSRSPPGYDHFTQAMQCMPDLTFFDGDPIEMTQVLCCAALYLQCLYRRGPAYRMLGTALRWALEHGMYTEMHGLCLDEAYVQRCSLVWWTIYTLERRMSSLLGVPMGISEESISASFPSISQEIQGANVLEMQVMLCQILAKVDLTVYGSDGKLDSRYLSATQSVLRDIANVTVQLNASFDLYANGSMSGTSRISAHLHLLEHQCIILTTRPLLYIFLQSKLGQSDPALMEWLQSATVKGLLHACVESAQQILRILSNLLEQGLLETFLPFDMDAAFISTIPLMMAATIDQSLLQDHSPWSQRAYTILEDMSTRGNICARLAQSELKQLDDELAQLFLKNNVPTALASSIRGPEDGSGPIQILSPGAPDGYTQSLELEFADSFQQHYELSPEQLMELANSLDLNSLTWPLPSMDDIPAHDL
ncbi:hypothetical protein P168DRAFT_334887 [Aspergillus campestris IBT 28561]|uniref:Xylanolytic transcriptional activator regulatory domain-containing protein n=1 Tax=Aspergillus campestris (strain IBT 28561) TaxID=1392248 RepID=A0A2I1CTP2_ASPC2|nr:uncharacterized protein P168DRAFT_334887 [Aspergillus campestris IBT 28561]PKY00984.1 hypothetical protein P168DRAFT_334887 [Aspergillus campestris IBT 28561]